MPFDELIVDLRSLAEFRSLIRDRPDLLDTNRNRDLGAALIEAGAVEPITGLTIPSGAMTCPQILREGLYFQRVSSRGRAVLLCFEEVLGDFDPRVPTIYAPEAVTPFALKLRGLFARFIGSEWTATEQEQKALWPVPFEDLQSLSYPDDIFDIVTTNDVLEHVPSIDRALGEIYRVLKPGGWHFGTVPFACAQEDSIVKARLTDGKIEYLTEPEYHGSPTSAEGCLVFEIPAWDILARARSLGFRDAFFRLIMSSRHACMDNDLGGVFVLCFLK